MGSLSFLGPLFHKDFNETYPSVGDWWQHLKPYEYAAVVLASAATLAALVLACVHTWHVFHYVSKAATRADLYWIVFMCPTVASCATVAMAIPKAATFLLAVAFTYLMMCVFVVCSLTVSMCGGLAKMSAALREVGVEINPWQFPFACCCFFLGKWEATESNIRRIQWVIFSSVILRVMLEIMNVVVFLELGNRLDRFFQISQVTSVLCTLIGFYGSYMLMPIGAILLPGYRVRFMFNLLDYSQLAYTVYRIAFDCGAFLDEHFLPKAPFWSSFVLALQMLLVSALATYFLRPTESALFDAFSGDYAKVSSNGTQSTTSATTNQEPEKQATQPNNGT